MWLTEEIEDCPFNEVETSVRITGGGGGGGGGGRGLCSEDSKDHEDTYGMIIVNVYE